jgi:hypothetical protein
MRSPRKPHHLPQRLATGAFILHSGIEKWKAGSEMAAGMHGMAVGAYPFLGKLPPERFIRLLSIGEITTGAILLAPFVPAAVAGAALTAFSGSLLTMYLRTPGLHKPGSIWPTQNGTAISKDVWMLGIGVGLLAESAADAAAARS